MTSRTNQTQQVIRKARKLWAPPPNLTVSQWSDSERRLSAESSAKPGKYSTAHTEYARDIMDAFNDPLVREIIGVFSAQMGKTSIIENAGGYHSHHDPCPIMIVLPTLEIAEAFSKDRLTPMIRDTPALSERFGQSRSKSSGDTLLHKKFPGGSITLAGANSFNSLASRPIRIVIGDEAAKWKGNEKGSPFRQVSARVKAFWNSKRAYFSTPTDASDDNEFWQVWERSDKRLFHVECPECKGHAVFTFDELPASLPSAVEVPRIILQWHEGEAIRTERGKIRRAEAAWFECTSCKHQIQDVERHKLVRSGYWKASQPFHGVAGFWGWQAMSPFSPALDIANEWLQALGSLSAMQSAKNETLGLPWMQAGDAPEWKRLFERAQLAGYSLGTVPEGALVLTAGVDVQPDRIEVQVLGWGRNRRCWLVDYQIFRGSIHRPEVWAELDAFLATVYQNSNGADFTIEKLCIDTGHEAEVVYDWGRKHKFGPVALIKGGPDTQTSLVATPSTAEIMRNGKRHSTGLKLYLLNVSEFKKELYGRLSLDPPNPEKEEPWPDGYFTICALTDTEEYCRQLTAEELVTRNVRGYAKREWRKTGRNESLDTWNYAAAGRVMLGIDRWTDPQWKAREEHAERPKPTEPPPSSAPQKPSWFGDRPKNWLR